MAAIEARTRTDGDDSYKVRWREEGVWQGETFRDKAAAEKFRIDVEAGGNRWPKDWVKGVGLVKGSGGLPQEDLGDTDFLAVFERWLKTRPDIQDDTKAKYRSIATGSLAPAFPTIGDVTDETIPAWITERLMVNKPKTIANHHGLLHSICEFAHDKKMILDNPCTKTRLPDPDDYSDGEETTTFLEGEEFALLLRCAPASARPLLRLAVATGMRFGELTALQVRAIDFGDRLGGQPVIKVVRAWKGAGATRKLGPPKTKKSRRDITVDPDTAALLRTLVAGKRPGDFLFATREGNALTNSLVADNWWQPTVRRARMAGLTKTPRFHDLRHTHASWLIAGNVPLPAIQLRLGHESITTTVDRYGHLVHAHQEVIWAAIQRFMPLGADDRDRSDEGDQRESA